MTTKVAKQGLEVILGHITLTFLLSSLSGLSAETGTDSIRFYNMLTETDELLSQHVETEMTLEERVHFDFDGDLW